MEHRIFEYLVQGVAAESLRTQEHQREHTKLRKKSTNAKEVP